MIKEQKYVVPETEVLELKSETIICYSPDGSAPDYNVISGYELD